MPIPPTRYIDAGPAVPQASASAAMMQGQAMANLGNSIAQVGEKGMMVAERLRKIDEMGKMQAIFSNMEEDAAQFSIDLMTREDTAAWPGEWKERSQKWKEKAREAGLSNDGLAKFDAHYMDWNTRRSIQFETLAANKTLELGRARVGNSLRYYAEHENWEMYQSGLDEARDAGLINSAEHQRGMMDMEKKRAESELRLAVENDPAGIVDADDEVLREQYPGSTPEMIRYAKQEAAKQEVKLAVDTARDLENQIYSDNPPTPDALEADPRFKSLKEGKQAKLAESLKADLAARYNDATKRSRATPQYQSMLMGKVAKDITNLDATDEMKVYEVESLLRQLERGPMKNHLASELSRRISGEPEDMSAVGLNLKLVDEAFKAGFFSEVKPGEPVRVSKLVNDGFLKEENLRAAGFDAGQVKQIMEGDGKSAPTNGKRLSAMRNLWQSRADKGAVEKLREKDPFKAAAVEAMIAEKTTVDYKSAETKSAESAAQWKAAAQYARTKKALLEWTKANPKKSQDVDAVRAELMRIIGPTRDDEFIDSALGEYDSEMMGDGFLPPRDAVPFEDLDLPFLND